MRFLIVDDEEITQELLRNVIKDYIGAIEREIKIDTAYDGEEALTKAKENDYDVIFMDVMMPKMDGFETTKKIRALHKKQPVIIMISALEDDYEIKKGFLSGVNWYLTKPIDIEELEIIINEIVALKFNKTDKKYVVEKSEEVEFFDFDSETNLEDFHANEEDKISAKEFMKQGIIDENDIHDLVEELEKFDVEDENFDNELESLLEVFIKILTISYVYEKLAYGMQVFYDLHKRVDLTKLNQNDLNIYKMFVNAFVDDLKKWVESVLITQDAIDIHYLDAALLSNSLQIELFLKEKGAL